MPKVEEALAGLMGETGMHLQGRPGFAAGRAGDFIISGVSQADVTEIIDVVDGATDSLADSAEAQQVAAELPADDAVVYLPRWCGDPGCPR